jgi:hypothetical protein
VAYTPDWESLTDALKRVVAAGTSENDAKTYLCDAMRDRKIAVRVRIAASDHEMRGQFFLSAQRNVGVPLHLKPGDFDWAQSRPLAPWRIGPSAGQHYTWLGSWQDRELDLIEVATADVIDVLCGEPSVNAPQGIPPAQSPQADAGERKTGPRPKKLEETKQTMRTEIANGQQTVAGLRDMLEKNLASHYGVSRDTARKARNEVLSEFVENSRSTNDK